MIRTTKACLIGSISELIYQLVSIKRKVLEVGKGDLPPCSTSSLYRLSSVKPRFLSLPLSFPLFFITACLSPAPHKFPVLRYIKLIPDQKHTWLVTASHSMKIWNRLYSRYLS